MIVLLDGKNAIFYNLIKKNIVHIYRSTMYPMVLGVIWNCPEQVMAVVTLTMPGVTGTDQVWPNGEKEWLWWQVMEFNKTLFYFKDIQIPEITILLTNAYYYQVVLKAGHYRRHQILFNKKNPLKNYCGFAD